MRYKRAIFAGCLIFCLLGLTQGVHAIMPELDINAEGMASGSDLTARDEALNRALRNAVEQGVGLTIDSETVIQNSKLLDDRIYSSVKGYVKNYEILSDNKGEGGLYRIKVKATVALMMLKKDIEALGIIKAQKNNPRITVIALEYVDGVEQPAGQLQSSISETFLYHDFPLIDKAQMEMVKNRDAVLNFDDPAKAAALGMRYGAEVAVIAEAKANLIDTSRPHGVSVFAYDCSAVAKAVKVDTAEVISTRSLSTTARGGGKVPTANKAIKDAGMQLAYYMVEDIVERWRDEIYNDMTIQLVCSNADAAKVERSKNALAKERSIKAVHERSLTGGVAVLEVELRGDADFLEQIMIRSLDFPLLLITAKTPNRIDLEFME